MAADLQTRPVDVHDPTIPRCSTADGVWWERKSQHVDPPQSLNPMWPMWPPVAYSMTVWAPTESSVNAGNSSRPAGRCRRVVDQTREREGLRIRRSTVDPPLPHVPGLQLDAWILPRYPRPPSRWSFPSLIVTSKWLRVANC